MAVRAFATGPGAVPSPELALPTHNMAASVGIGGVRTCDSRPLTRVTARAAHIGAAQGSSGASPAHVGLAWGGTGPAPAPLGAAAAGVGIAKARAGAALARAGVAPARSSLLAAATARRAMETAQSGEHCSQPRCHGSVSRGRGSAPRARWRSPAPCPEKARAVSGAGCATPVGCAKDRGSAPCGAWSSVCGVPSATRGSCSVPRSLRWWATPSSERRREVCGVRRALRDAGPCSCCSTAALPSESTALSGQPAALAR
jgi:hypothetical protein